MKSFFISFLILLTISIALYLRFPYSLQTTEEKFNLVCVFMSLCYLITMVSNHSVSHMVNRFSVWRFLSIIMILILLFVGYVYKDEILNSKLMSKLIPSRPIISTEGDVIVSAANDGQFEIEALINNQKILCLVDTGASVIIIDQKDAAKIGINPQSLIYNIESNTANGVGHGARINIDYFQIGTIIFKDVEIMVNQEPTGSCLLGMSFLRRLKKFSISNDQLTMTP